VTAGLAWDYVMAGPCGHFLFLKVLGIEPRVLCMPTQALYHQATCLAHGHSFLIASKFKVISQEKS
jgi:hypothetical protein